MQTLSISEGTGIGARDFEKIQTPKVKGIKKSEVMPKNEVQARSTARSHLTTSNTTNTKDCK